MCCSTSAAAHTLKRGQAAAAPLRGPLAAVGKTEERQAMPLLPPSFPNIQRGASTGAPCRLRVFVLWCCFIVFAAPKVGAIQIGTSRSQAHRGSTMKGNLASLPRSSALHLQPQPQLHRGVQVPAFAAPLGSLRSLLRRKNKQGDAETDDDASTTDTDSNDTTSTIGSEVSSNTATDSTSNSTNTTSNPTSTASPTAAVQEALESAVGAAVALASEQLEAMRQELHLLLLQQALQQTAPKHGASSEVSSQHRLPVTELSAAAVGAAAKKKLHEVVGKTAAAAARAEALQRAEDQVAAFIESEVRSLFQQQMQQRILLVLQSFLSLDVAADVGKKSSGTEQTLEQQMEAATAAVMQEFETLLQQCVPSPQVRERWACGELRQLLQQQLRLHTKTVRMQRSEQQQQAETLLRVVQQQQGLLQQLQQQLQQEHQPRPFSMGAAYRVPDTNLQIAAATRQGRLQLNVTCVPDDSPAAASGVLGQQGFVRGIEGLGNLGLSCSFSL